MSIHISKLGAYTLLAIQFKLALDRGMVRNTSLSVNAWLKERSEFFAIINIARKRHCEWIGHDRLTGLVIDVVVDADCFEGKVDVIVNDNRLLGTYIAVLI